MLITIEQSNKIDAIIFVLVGVLLFQKANNNPKTIEELNADKIESLYNHLDDKKLISDVKNQFHLTDQQIADSLPFIPKKFERFNDLWAILPALKQHYKLAILNNGNAVAWDYWKKDFDFRLFDEFINSAQMGVKKPDPKIYLLTCNKLGVNPTRCLFMDNNKENIETAEKLGMKVLWWNKVNSKEANLKLFLNLLSTL